MEIVSVVDEGLGHSSHVVGLDDRTALVVDPARFPERQRQLVAERGWRVAWSADTHSHADYISGSPELADDGAVFLAPARARLEHAHRGLEPGEDVELTPGVMLRAIATPGHTPEHLAYLLEQGGAPVALFSGGSLMVGTVGRTDLLGDEHREELAAQLFRALHDEILTLPDDLAVYPTHGAGSFCSAPSGADRTTTIGRERATNPLLQLTMRSSSSSVCCPGSDRSRPTSGYCPNATAAGFGTTAASPRCPASARATSGPGWSAARRSSTLVRSRNSPLTTQEGRCRTCCDQCSAAGSAGSSSWTGRSSSCWATVRTGPSWSASASPSATSTSSANSTAG